MLHSHRLARGFAVKEEVCAVKEESLVVKEDW